MLKRSKWLSRIGAAALGAAMLATPASARDFVQTYIDLDLQSQAFKAYYTLPGSTEENPLVSPRDIADGIFIRIDLKIKLADEASAKEVRRRVDDSYVDGESSGCGPEEAEPWRYGPLTMEDGLRYTFSVNVPAGDGSGAERITAVIFPGNRSDHFSNDVFCEYSEELGPTGGIFRLTGFYHVIHRRTQGGWDVQLRAVQLTPQEIENNF